MEEIVVNTFYGLAVALGIGIGTLIVTRIGHVFVFRVLASLLLLYGVGCFVSPTPDPEGAFSFVVALFLFMATTCDDGPYIGY